MNHKYNMYASDFASDFTKERIIEINHDQMQYKHDSIVALLWLLLISVFMIIPYGFFLSGSLSHNGFVSIFTIVMLTYMFVMIYRLDIYNVRTIIHQHVQELNLDQLNRRIAQYINKNCKCPN